MVYQEDNKYILGLEHFYNTEMLNENGLRELIKLLHERITKLECQLIDVGEKLEREKY